MSTDTPNSSLPTSDIMRDIVFWRNKRQSIVVVLVSIAIWVLLEVYQFNFITVLSWLAMFLVTSLFLWGNLLRLFGKEPSDFSRLEIREESAVRFGMTLHAWTEESIKWMLKLGAESDVFSFALAVGGLWLLSQVGHYFDLLSLLCIGVLMGVTLPPIYVRNEENLTRVRERVKIYMQTGYEMFDDRVIKKVKSKVGSTTTTTTTTNTTAPTDTPVVEGTTGEEKETKVE